MIALVTFVMISLCIDSESTESAPVEETEEEGPKQLTLEEWKKMEEAKRVKSEFKIRKANEGADMSQWKGTQMYRKVAGQDDSEEEEEESDDEEDVSLLFNIVCV